MGEDLQRWQNQQFRHRQDVSYRELRAKDLFSDRPEILSQSYSCQLARGVTLALTDALLARLVGEAVQIWRGNEVVGEAQDSLLREVVMKCKGTHGVELGERSDLLGFFTVRVRTEEDP